MDREQRSSGCNRAHTIFTDFRCSCCVSLADCPVVKTSGSPSNGGARPFYGSPSKLQVVKTALVKRPVFRAFILRSLASLQRAPVPASAGYRYNLHAAPAQNARSGPPRAPEHRACKCMLSSASRSASLRSLASERATTSGGIVEGPSEVSTRSRSRRSGRRASRTASTCESMAAASACPSSTAWSDCWCEPVSRIAPKKVGEDPRRYR